jgi:hypothetical protein
MKKLLLLLTAVASLGIVNYAKATLRVPLDPKIHSNYAEPAKGEGGFPIIAKTEEYLGTDEFRGPILTSFVDLGADGVAILDLLESQVFGFISPKDTVIGVNDGHFPLPYATPPPPPTAAPVEVDDPRVSSIEPGPTPTATPIKIQGATEITTHEPKQIDQLIRIITFQLSMLVAIATTHYPTIVIWSPLLITLIVTMVCPRHGIPLYRNIACVIWTIIAVILGALGHWMGQLNIVDLFLVGVNNPSLRPLTDWIQNDHGLLILMISAPWALWIVIMLQVCIGGSIMAVIPNWGRKTLILLGVLFLGFIAASTIYKSYHQTFHYRDYLTRLALYTGDLNACDTLGLSPYNPGVMRYPFRILPTGITDDEFNAQMYGVPTSCTTYYLQMAHLEAARVRLGGKRIFHWRIKNEVCVDWSSGSNNWIEDFPMKSWWKANRLLPLSKREGSCR